MTEKKEIDDGGMVCSDPALFAEAHGAIRVGFSKREYFASKAPPMTDQWWSDSKPKDRWLKANAAWCVAHADALIEALKK